MSKLFKGRIPAPRKSQNGTPTALFLRAGKVLRRHSGSRNIAKLLKASDDRAKFIIFLSGRATYNAWADATGNPPAPPQPTVEDAYRIAAGENVPERLTARAAMNAAAGLDKAAEVNTDMPVRDLLPILKAADQDALLAYERAELSRKRPRVTVLEHIEALKD